MPYPPRRASVVPNPLFGKLGLQALPALFDPVRFQIAESRFISLVL